ncbi:MAG TPA: ABC transporter substrate-binding protein [Candidatus Acidoferrales bacterium]|nr:ABC transporter substrate-binding protein [Candidatus Acidoferrales bacterium]
MRLYRIALAASLAIVLSTIAPSLAQQKTKLSVGLIKIAGLTSVYAAQQLGYFNEQGLDVDLTFANNGNELLTALQSGKLDISLAIPGVAMRAREVGYKVSLVFQNELSHGKPPDTGALLVKTDSPISSVKQLAGKKVAHSGIGTQAWAAVRYVEQKAGLDVNSVQELELGYGQMPGALQQGLVDAIASVDPFTSAVINAKQGKVISWFYVESVPNQPEGAFWASDDWLAKNAATARKFRIAMDKAHRYLNSHPEDAKKMVAAFTGLKPEQVESMTPIVWNDRVNRPDWQKVSQMLIATGALKQPVDLNALIPAAAVNPGR